MKCNFKERQRKENVDRLSRTLDTVKRLWEMASILALHREFGFGEKRLKQFAETVSEVYAEIDSRASITDSYNRSGRKMTNLDEAVIRVIRELRADGIDHREILGDDEKLVIFREDGSEIDLDRFVDELEKRDKMRAEG